jgi:carbonic anhydrase
MHLPMTEQCNVQSHLVQQDECAVCGPDRSTSLSRRLVLSGSIAGLMGAAASNRASGQTPLTPDEALNRMMTGNGRFIANNLASFGEDLAILKQKNIGGQEPFAAVLSCADSRVPVELAFDQSIGHVFVARIAGNVCTPEITATLEYGAAVLGTAVIMVLGHSGCGAVKATMAGKAVPGQISALYAPIRQAVERAGHDLEAAIKANAQIQADLLRNASPVLAELIQRAKLKILAAYYDIGTGRVSLLD